MRYARFITALVVLASATSLPGCQFFPHWMQPNQLWKLNRQPAYDESAFSVPDPGEPPVLQRVGVSPASTPVSQSGDEEMRD